MSRSDLETTSFAAYARRMGVRVARIWCGCLAVLALPTWAIDRAVYDDPAVLGASLTWRAVVTVVLLAGFVAGWRCDPAWLRRNLYRGGAVFVFALGLAVGAGQGAMGGLQQPSFAGLYLLPFVGVVLIAPLRARVGVSLGCLAGVLVGWLSAAPAQLGHPHLGMVLGLLGFAWLVAIAVGHAITALVRVNYEQALRLAARSDLLEAQVAARTRELRELAEHIDGAREDERRRISRELHDDLGQLLTMLRFEVELPARSGARERARDYLDRAVASLRAVILDLRPPVLDEQGLVAAVQWLCERHEETTGVACGWTVELDEAQVGEREKTAVFRLLQEALGNAARHARARAIEVVLREHDGCLQLLVEDDGVGFHGAPRGRFGLLGMRERARRLGGAAHIDSRPGRGTRIDVVIPLPSARRELAA
ncbi:sensor histidine kinase [Nannocystis pusilla]|uniref:sensor histidine kinase n=1 Tax=Nannocystis pusilla TaxID=889268 RepID=UPI003BEFBF2B